MKLSIYLDYMATTPVDAAVAAKMMQCLTQEDVFGNPGSGHCYGQAAASLVDKARAQVAALIQAAPREIIFTSGATEANNIAIRGAALARAAQGKHIITSAIEHKAVLDVCHNLEKAGFCVTYLPPNAQGTLDIAALAQAIRPETTLVSLMHVNNEIGVVNDIAAIGAITRAKGIWLHVDAAQSAGRLPLDLSQLPVDLMSFAAHKVYGPKGIGALYVRLIPRVRLEPILFGGGQEQGLRPGTLATHQIVGMGEAFALAQSRMAEDVLHIRHLTAQLWEGLRDLPGVRLNGSTDLALRSPGNLNICFADTPVEMLRNVRAKIAVSPSSACSIAMNKPSHVLQALGLTPEQISRSLRFSLGRYTTAEEIDAAIKYIRAAV